MIKIIIALSLAIMAALCYSAFAVSQTKSNGDLKSELLSDNNLSENAWVLRVEESVLHEAFIATAKVRGLARKKSDPIAVQPNAPPFSPDLQPYQPGGWDDKLVISNVTGTTTSAVAINDTETVYLDYSCVNFGDTSAGAFRIGIWVDNIQLKFAEISSLDSFFYVFILDSDLGTFSSGWHTFTIKCDYEQNVTETDETNNEYSRDFFISSSSAQCYDPPTYDYEITPSQSWQTTGDVSVEIGGCRVYKMFLSSDCIYNFSTCSIDGSGGSSVTGDSDFRMYDSGGTFLWYIDGAFGCGYDASTIGSSYEDWSPPADGYYYLQIKEFFSSLMTYDLAYKGYCPPQDAQIHGVKWNDWDNDGVKDPNEPGLANWRIYLDENANGLWDNNEPNDLTDPNGNYSFTNLLAGTYRVAEEEQIDWTQTYPVDPVVTSQEAAIMQAQVEFLLAQITTTGSQEPIYIYGEVVPPKPGQIMPMTSESGSLINMDAFRSDPRFSGIDGNGYATVILDTGIDLNHPFFGPDNDSDGVADRIVYHHDFADNDNDASDNNGHGSNVSSIVASQDSTYTGMAPGVDIIHLKVFQNSGAGNFGWVELALQWVVSNAATYNIVSVNMSLGDSGNYTTAQSLYGIGDELAALEALDVIVASASGNDFFPWASQQGVIYPSADASSLSIGAVYDASTGGWSYSSGAIAFSSGADRITPFSQRHSVMTSIMAPGAPITGANQNGGTVTFHGTSQASPHISGIAVLAQQLADSLLGRRLTLTEFASLLDSTGVTINDGDDEDDNVTNTNLNFKRVDMLALAEAIYLMGGPGTHTVNLDVSEIVTGINFGNHHLPTTLDISKTGNGRVRVDGVLQTLPWSDTFNYGSNVNLETVPYPSSKFDSWLGDLSGSENPTTITMDDDKNVTARFVLLSCGDWCYYSTDFDQSCSVGAEDISFFLTKWLLDTCAPANNYCDGTDINMDGNVTVEDFVYITDQWQRCTYPQGFGCDDMCP